MRQSDEDAGLRVGQARGIEARVLDGIPGRFQQQAVLGVDRGRFALGHAEEIAIKAADVVKEGPPPRYRAAGHAGFGVVIQVRVPPVGGNFVHEIVAAQRCIPQL